MAVRVRLRIEVEGCGALESTALVNTGFETETPQFLIPVEAAVRLGLWPSLPPESRVEIYDTPGVYVIPGKARVSVLAGDRESPRVASDIVLSHTEVEIPVSDKLAEGALGSDRGPGQGIRGFRDDPPGKVRVSERPERWI